MKLQQPSSSKPYRVRRITGKGTYLLPFIVLASAQIAHADNYYWRFHSLGGDWPIRYSADDACRTATGIGWTFSRTERYYDTLYLCYFKNLEGHEFQYYTANRGGTSCPEDSVYNMDTGACDCAEGGTVSEAGACPSDGPDKGPPPPEGCTGNPINITNGNKYQVEHDFSAPISLSRYYNGLDGLWRHSFSAHLTRKNDRLLLIRENGKASEFMASGNGFTSSTDLGKLTQSAGKFSYISELNEAMEFNQDGRLTRLMTGDGRTYSIERSDSLTISDERGNKLVLVEGANHQLLRAQSGGVSVEYAYNKEQHLIAAIRSDGQYSTKTQYLYEDKWSGKPLTGILDNNNRRFATWTYDNQGRALSSEHANGAEKVSLAYNDDGSTTVTNEYGKQATYRFQVIQGIKRIVAIEGEPSPNCPSSNSTFTYDERGLLTSKRDNNGNLTTYQYNARGLETSRTEAVGTAQARTITTDWHPSLFLPVQVSEPGRITRYQYDAEGRKTGETVTTR